MVNLDNVIPIAYSLTDMAISENHPIQHIRDELSLLLEENPSHSTLEVGSFACRICQLYAIYYMSTIHYIYADY